LEVLVKQTVEKHPNCRKRAQEVYAEHFRLKTRPTEEDLLKLLKTFTTMLTACFYFLDALDEAPEPIQLDLLIRLSSLNVKLFITSRPLEILQAEFPDTHYFTIAAQDRDLELLINEKIERSLHLRRLLKRADPSWQVKIVSTVKEKCRGMSVSIFT
jgi:ankyrin repeat domain-containing protein 50